MAPVLGADRAALDALNGIADKARIRTTGNYAGGDPDVLL
jgi:hypothetical protein